VPRFLKGDEPALPEAAAASHPALGQDLSNLRHLLNQRFDDPGLDALCLDHFPEVFDRFSRGMRKDEKSTLLLDHCRREPTQYQKLLAALKGQTDGQ